MELVTAEEMRRLDRMTIERLGIPAIALMENAGRAIAEEVIAFCRSRQYSCGAGRPGDRADGCGQSIESDIVRRTFAGGRSTIGDELIIGPPRDFRVSGDRALTLDTAAAEHWLILVGKGNNGGDGLAAARHLREAGIAVTLVYAAAPETLAGEAAVQHGAAAALGIPAAVHGRDVIDFAGCTGIVDALLGTGSAGAPRGAYAALIAAANVSGKPVVSADIPSGLDADTGELHEPCIHAAVTVCLALLKRGLVQYPGAGAAGRVVVRSIGIPAALARQAGVQASLLTPEVLQTRLGIDVSRRRSPEGHKGTYGHVLLAAGSLSMSGAGLLAARAALRAGCGLVTWALPAALMPYVIGAAPEVMLAAAGGGEDGTWNAGTAAEVLRLSGKCDVAATGPGLGRFAGDKEWLRMLWEGIESPLVLDADALNILAECDRTGWSGPERPVILTPHPGEMARLAGVSTAEVQRDRIGLAQAYAVQHGVILVLKGAHTVIASPEGEVYVNATGHPGMGTGGAGDVLTGIISGLLAQGLGAVQAAAFGVYLHGLAGERAAGSRNHPSALVAGDIIGAL
ncbi:carbohydrate kinase [Paenibacillus sp. FSL R7-0273]|uniref:bifunctional ADP-dependent NAD(P)H-hydrate dehydratase/NAD(P)H-hydrate epimerase n=1 Tax=Paenibacillus sp. FSL R7-0273 TaxID=1536772 RepID=UPI0004F7D01D|nr:bifunctional ADP-dependent NAD(P)H-hydrate dehydratase/NAD(P)H-hydrate epimerase [Paenibacillus sp. FSL R7-0273]AIQ44805.1 carbohydrate kinase [Paenibacillus sp. FSL R7-0273]OMF93334.1 bifunctional ADP-dependent (S)-NAD(P)H-hydrate dehydratase/NAD(P)H-hydrate epimerase [Paenibacillus sp. FSL R7-0273]